MPTFNIVKEHNSCDFNFNIEQLINSLEKFSVNAANNFFPKNHPLFGKMTLKDWGFLQYKHLDHHLKQFGK